MSEQFKLINSSMTIPVITEGKKGKPTSRIVGDKNVADLFNYLIDNYPTISQKLYPPEQGEEITEMLNWFKRDLRRNTSRLIRDYLIESNRVRDSIVDNESFKNGLTLFNKTL